MMEYVSENSINVVFSRLVVFLFLRKGKIDGF